MENNQNQNSQGWPPQNSQAVPPYPNHAFSQGGPTQIPMNANPLGGSTQIPTGANPQGGWYGNPTTNIPGGMPNYAQNGMPGNLPNGVHGTMMNGMPGSMPVNQPKNAKQNPRKSKKKMVTLGIFGGVGLVLGILLFILVNKYARQLSVVSIPGAPIVNSSGEVVAGSDGEVVQDAAAEIDMNDMTIEKGEAWDGSTRITCLAMGLDYRDWVENDGSPRSDTMMLLTYDPVTGYAGMLSLPRDLWVAIPDHGYGRINTAYSLGEGEKLPGGGAGLAMQTVELFLGVDIQYYAVINFYGFIDFIDTIDKLAINVRDDITVDPLGQGNTVHLMAGVQDLDGATALAYARYRYTNGGDFERAQRQQDVIYAIYEQMVWQLPELLTTKADALFASIQKAVTTNIPLSDMLKLAWTVVDIPDYKILRSVIAPPDQVLYDATADGTQQILVPIPDKIREARDAIFSTNISAAPSAGAWEEDKQIAEEAAKVTIMNGSTVSGLLEQTIAYFQSKGITVVNTGTGTVGYTNSLEIKDGKPYTAKFFQDTLAIPTSAVTLNYDPGNDIDLVVTITDAWANSNPMGQ